MKEKMIKEAFAGFGFSVYKKLIYDNFGLLSPTVYDNSFDMFAKSDGLQLFEKSLIEEMITNNKYEYVISYDNEKYSVFVEFNKDDLFTIEDAQCNCQKFIKDGFSCKHIFACVYKTQCSNNILIFKKLISEGKEKLSKYAMSTISFIKENVDVINKITNKDYSKRVKLIENTVLNHLNDKNENNNLTDYKLYNIYDFILKSFNYITTFIIDLKVIIDKYDNKDIKKDLKQKINNVFAIYDGYIDSVDKTTSKKDKEELSLLNENSYYIKAYYELYDLSQKVFYHNDYYEEQIDIKERLLDIYRALRLDNKNLKEVYEKCHDINTRINSEISILEKQGKAARRSLNERIYERVREKQAIVDQKREKLELELRNIRDSVGKSLVTPLGLINLIFAWGDEIEQEETKKEAKRLEEEMDLFDLDEEEREAVLSGDYEPWNFDYPSDRELEEEDYYYDSIDL